MTLPTRWIGWGVSAVVALGAVAQPARPLVVVGPSMSPTYANGELLWTKPVDRPLRRGDVVVADTPEGPVMKRVALLEGDHRLQWGTRAGWLDTTLCDVPDDSKVRRSTRRLAVPVGTVFLLGDNLGVSVDSRTYGPVPVGKIRGIVVDNRPPNPRSGVDSPTARKWIAGAIKAGRLLNHACGIVPDRPVHTLFEPECKRL